MKKFFPYSKQYIDDEDIEAVKKVLKSDFLTTGPKVSEFERKISDITGAMFAVVVSNGTAALHLASLALLEKGSRVITTPNTFLSTVNSIMYAGAMPVFVDIGEDGNIDLEKAEELLEKDRGIKALYPVHFSGKPVNQEVLKRLKERFNVKILEDCAHSMGAEYRESGNRGIKAGSCTYSDISIVSFHPVKHITSGEGGAITTKSREIYEKILKLRTHGIQKNNCIHTNMAFDTKGNKNPWYYEMQELGFNYRITDIQCALGISQLKKLDFFVQRRREIAQIYDALFKGTVIQPLYEYDDASSYHLYVIRVPFKTLPLTRAECMNRLQEKGIGTQVHYIPVNKQPYYTKLGFGKEETPCMDLYYEEALSIPLYPGLLDKDLEYIGNTIKETIEKL
ncbi:MAG: UDP-4-amino-4,6-dideoxy-N-acetyl-beta-L-altrosamine transaminase [bacterium]